MIRPSLRILIVFPFILLSACFSSDAPLLTEDDAVTPFPDSFALFNIDLKKNNRIAERYDYKRTGKEYFYADSIKKSVLTFAVLEHDYVVQNIITLGGKQFIDYCIATIVINAILCPASTGGTELDVSLKNAGVVYKENSDHHFIFSNKEQLLKAFAVYKDVVGREHVSAAISKTRFYVILSSQQQIDALQKKMEDQNAGVLAETETKTQSSGSAEQECDALAADRYDLSRPAGVPGVESKKIDAARAEAACQRAIRERSSPRVLAQLGRALDAGHKHAEADAKYRGAAEQGSPVGQFYLGLMYDTGEGIARDANQAVMWYRKAADQGYAPAQNNLGILYDDGDGVPKDATQAALLYRKAAEQGYPEGQHNLGNSYHDGTGVSRDAVQAVFWYRKAAEQGLPEAQYSLGQLYQKGAGVARDDSQAAFWYRKAAEQGNANAENDLGVLYYNNGDTREAVFWLQKAADQGIAEAQSNLALAYRQQAPSANSSPSAGRSPIDEWVDQTRADQSRQDRENADAQRREWEETNRQQMEDVRRGQELYNQQHQ